MDSGLRYNLKSGASGWNLVFTDLLRARSIILRDRKGDPNKTKRSTQAVLAHTMACKEGPMSKETRRIEGFDRGTLSRRET